LRLHEIHLDLLANGAPADLPLWNMALEYCHANMLDIESTSAADKMIRSVTRCWVVVSMNAAGEVERIHGITGLKLAPDFPFWRVSGEYADRATEGLRERVNAYLADNGYRGREAFIYLSDKETDAQRCSKWKESLEAAGAEPAQRFSVVVR
jgi:hypothetical protein